MVFVILCFVHNFFKNYSNLFLMPIKSASSYNLRCNTSRRNGILVYFDFGKYNWFQRFLLEQIANLARGCPSVKSTSKSRRTRRLSLFEVSDETDLSARFWLSFMYACHKVESQFGTALPSVGITFCLVHDTSKQVMSSKLAVSYAKNGKS